MQFILAYYGQHSCLSTHSCFHYICRLLPLPTRANCSILAIHISCHYSQCLYWFRSLLTQLAIALVPVLAQRWVHGHKGIKAPYLSATLLLRRHNRLSIFSALTASSTAARVTPSSASSLCPRPLTATLAFRRGPPRCRFVRRAQIWTRDRCMQAC